MDDILERLRAREVNEPAFSDAQCFGDAAREIERLRSVAELAGCARAAQRAYFTRRSRENLVASKQAERALDVALSNGDPFL